MNSNLLYLTQTDTTVGFVSSEPKKLSHAKQRDKNQPFLIAVDSYKKLKQISCVPKVHRKRVRRTKKTSYLYPDKNAIRVIQEPNHLKFLKEFDFLYTTSANKNQEPFDIEYAKKEAEVVIEDCRGLHQFCASAIIKLGKIKVKKLR